VKELCDSVGKVTSEELRTVAEEVYDPSRLTTLIYR